MAPASFEPYIGPRPFARRDAQFFFGRESEANELFSLVVAHPISLIYGRSTTGKSSLINAAVIPRLEQVEDAKVLPIARFRESPPSQLKSPTQVNIYTFNTLTCWEKANPNPNSIDLAHQSLRDFLAKTGETSFGGDDSARFTVAIFDQFEEIFTLYPERWEDRQQFFLEIREALDANRLLRVLFSMREDFIGELDPYVDLLPDRLRTRFRLEPLRAPAALSALTNPLITTHHSFGPGVAEQLIDKLLAIRIRTDNGWEKVKGQYVEALQLQIVAQSLWSTLNPEEKTITKAHLDIFGDVETALIAFYEKAIQSVILETGISEGVIRQWFENSLITPDGKRGTVYRGGEKTAGIPNQVVDLLADRRLLSRELRGGGVWYELSHDRFIKPVRDSNQSWLRAHAGDNNTSQRLEERAAAWVRAGRLSAGLLNESELLEADQWLSSPQAEEVGYSEQLLLLRSASQTALANRTAQQEQALTELQQRADRARTAKRLQVLMALLGLLFLWAVIATILLWLR